MVTAKPEQIAGGDLTVRQPITLPLIKTEPTLEPAKAFTRPIRVGDIRLDPTIPARFDGLATGTLVEPTFQNLSQAFGSAEFDPLLERSRFTFSEFFELFRGGLTI